MTHQQQTAFENIDGKGEIARNEQFPLFLQCFQLNQITVSQFVHIFDVISLFADVISLFAVELEEPKIGISGRGLKRHFYPNVISWGLECRNKKPRCVFDQQNTTWCFPGKKGFIVSLCCAIASKSSHKYVPHQVVQ